MIELQKVCRGGGEGGGSNLLFYNVIMCLGNTYEQLNHRSHNGPCFLEEGQDSVSQNNISVAVAYIIKMAARESPHILIICFLWCFLFYCLGDNVNEIAGTVLPISSWNVHYSAISFKWSTGIECMIFFLFIKKRGYIWLTVAVLFV